MANITQFDDKQKRCPLLGHQIGFTYCKSPGTDFPCKKILDCWFEQINIVDFVREHYGEEAIEKLSAPSKPKILSLIELIEQAQKRQTNK